MRFSAGLLCGVVGTMMVFLGEAALRGRSSADATRLAPLAVCDPDKPEVFSCLPKWPPSRP